MKREQNLQWHLERGSPTEGFEVLETLYTVKGIDARPMNQRNLLG